MDQFSIVSGKALDGIAAVHSATPLAEFAILLF